MAHFVGVEHKMRPQPTFSVSVQLWLHSDMYIWAPFFGPSGHQVSKSGGHLEL